VMEGLHDSFLEQKKKRFIRYYFKGIMRLHCTAKFLLMIFTDGGKNTILDRTTDFGNTQLTRKALVNDLAIIRKTKLVNLSCRNYCYLLWELQVLSFLIFAALRFVICSHQIFLIQFVNFRE